MKIRDLINIVEAAQRSPAVKEAALPLAKNAWDKEFVVYENPTEEEFMALANGAVHGNIRATIFDDGYLLAWDGELGLHSDVDAAHDVSGGYNIQIWPHVIDRQGNDRAAVMGSIRNNPTLVKLGVAKMRSRA